MKMAHKPRHESDDFAESIRPERDHVATSRQFRFTSRLRWSHPADLSIQCENFVLRFNSFDLMNVPSYCTPSIIFSKPVSIILMTVTYIYNFFELCSNIRNDIYMVLVVSIIMITFT
jgi:hypothetical protein